MEGSWRTAGAGFLFSPASLYPVPAAYVVDESGTVLHKWSHVAHQPSPEDDPPNNLRGWNHVAVGADGSLFAVVPLRALLKLTPGSELEWSAGVSAHHDLAIDDSGAVAVLTEAPRLVIVGARRRVVLDNRITFLDQSGAIADEVSLYDVLRTDQALKSLIDESTLRRGEEFERRGWPLPEDGVTLEVARETRQILQTAQYEGELWQALRRLRALPGSPCDVMHTNTLELLDAHPAGLWERGAVMLCMRELNTVAVVDVASASVRWWWGVDSLSGPHQPSVLPDGRILVFDNGTVMGRTRLVVVEPVTGEVAWSWAADPPESFFCPLAGGCERMPNGNLLVTNSTEGAAFELAMDGRIERRLSLPAEMYGTKRGRVSIYRMSVVRPDVVARLQRHRAAPEIAIDPDPAHVCERCR